MNRAYTKIADINRRVFGDQYDHEYMVDAFRVEEAVVRCRPRLRSHQAVPKLVRFYPLINCPPDSSHSI